MGPWQTLQTQIRRRSVCVAERLAISDHWVAGSNPAAGELFPKPKRHFIAQSLSCSPFHRLEMTEILLKGRKTLTHLSIQIRRCFLWHLIRIYTVCTYMQEFLIKKYNKTSIPDIPKTGSGCVLGWKIP